MITFVTRVNSFNSTRYLLIILTNDERNVSGQKSFFNRKTKPALSVTNSMRPLHVIRVFYEQICRAVKNEYSENL